MRKKVIGAGIALVLGFLAWKLVPRTMQSGEPRTIALSPEIVSQAPSLRGHRRVFAPGSQRTFDVRTEHRVLMNGSDFLHFIVSGRWRLTVLDTSSSVAHIRGELLDARASSKEQGKELYPEAMQHAMTISLGKAFYMTLELDGRLDKLHLPEEQAVIRGVWRTLAAETQVVVAPGTMNAWQARESDPTGDYEVHYRLVGEGALEKNKSRYLTVAGGSGAQAAPTVEVVTSRKTIQIDHEGWPVSIDGSEHLRMVSSGDGPRLESYASLSLHLVSTGQVAASKGFSPKELGVKTVDVWSTVDDEGLRRIADRNLVGGASYEDLLSSLAAAKDDHDATVSLMGRLEALFRLDPSATERAASSIARGLDATQAAVVTSALGTAATPEAQHALVTMLRSNPDPSIVQHAVIALGLVDDPAEESVTALRAAASSSHEDVSSAATLAMGNAARRMEYPDEASSLVEELMRRFQEARDEDAQVLLLGALGNTGDEQILPIVQPLLASASPRLRRSAVEALRLLDAPGVDGWLAQRLLQDPEPEVRLGVVMVAAIRSLGPLLPALGQALQSDSNIDVQLGILGVCDARRAEVPELLSLISWAGTQAKQERVREEAQAILARK